MSELHRRVCGVGVQVGQVPRDTDVRDPVDDVAEKKEGTEAEEMGLASREGGLVGHEEEVEDVGEEENEDDGGAPPHEGVAEEVDDLARVVHVLGPVQHAPDVQRPGVPIGQNEEETS